MAQELAVTEEEAVVEESAVKVTRDFDPVRHLTKVTGRDYLEVKWRLVWVRSQYPDARIETELVSHKPGEMAIVKATVTLPPNADGWSAVSSDYGMEERSDFGDYLEKAATKAIGRALGSLGFGTQFSGDHEFGADAGRVVDSPVGQGGGYANAGGGGSAFRGGGGAGGGGGARGANNIDIPPTNTPDGLGWMCEVAGCNNRISDSRNKPEWTAGKLAGLSVKTQGHILCYSHKQAKERGENLVFDAAGVDGAVDDSLTDDLFGNDIPF